MDISVFLKGMLMGLCDLVPGVSGGTIAFITGIYSRLIHAIKKIFSFSFFVNFFYLSFLVLFYPTKKNRKKYSLFYKEHDLYFLCTLFFGILLSIVIGSRVILYLLSSFFVITMMFFIGLIFTSSFFIYRSVKKSDLFSRLFALYGLLFGAVLIFLSPVSPNLSYLYIFFSGFISVFAMLLPGVSGSYLLYLFGSYEFILSFVSDFLFDYIFVFLIGGILGLLCISRMVSYLLDNHYARTLYFLFGFVLGSLLIPIRDVISYGISYFDILFGLVSFCFGVCAVLFVEKASHSY